MNPGQKAVELVDDMINLVGHNKELVRRLSLKIVFEIEFAMGVYGVEINSKESRYWRKVRKDIEIYCNSKEL